MTIPQFAVWAPVPSTVTLHVRPVGGTAVTVPMTRDDEGWWSVDGPLPVGPSGQPGVGEFDYGYELDHSGEVRPDPRSRRQPEGVHGWSRTYDPFAFTWTDERWPGRQLPGGVIYEMHVGTFTPEGTLDAAVGKLDHLVELGADFVEIMPVNDFNGVWNWGYDGVLWFAVHEVYGGPEAYQRFVDACHARGLGVIQDVVYNHMGPSGNYLPEFGPYLNAGGTNTWGESPNLDGEDSDEVRAYIVDNVHQWLRDYHVDGLRLDAVHALHDTRATHILEELAIEAEVLSAFVGRPLSLIAESDLNDPRLITSREGGGYGLNAQWSDDFHHALYVSLTGDTSGYYADFDSLEALGKVTEAGFFHTGTRSSFRGRSHGSPIDTLRTPTWRLVVCSDNHDQIGNRATGERLSARLSDRPARHRGGRDAAQPVHPDDLHGRGVGRAYALALLHLPPRARARRRGPGGADGGVQGDGLGHLEHPGPAGPRDLLPAPSWTGRSPSSRSTRRCSRSTGGCCRSGARSRRSPTRASTPATPVPTTTSTGWC